MLPFIIAAAASILANQQKQRQERQQLYLKELEQNASRFGGNTQLADVYDTERQIGSQGANYGSALGLVGKLGSDSGPTANTNPDDVFGPTSYAHDAGGVQYNDPVTLDGSSTQALDPYADFSQPGDRGPIGTGSDQLLNPYPSKSDRDIDILLRGMKF